MKNAATKIPAIPLATPSQPPVAAVDLPTVFCFADENATKPMLSVQDSSPKKERLKKGYLLIATIGEVVSKSIAQGDDSQGKIIDVSTAFLIQFAAEAAAALVESVEVND